MFETKENRIYWRISVKFRRRGFLPGVVKFIEPERRMMGEGLGGVGSWFYWGQSSRLERWKSSGEEWQWWLPNNIMLMPAKGTHKNGQNVKFHVSYILQLRNQKKKQDPMSCNPSMSQCPRRQEMQTLLSEYLVTPNVTGFWSKHPFSGSYEESAAHHN